MSATDALGRRTEYAYDDFANVTSLTAAAGTSEAVTTTFTYEPAFNQLASVTDPLNHTTSFAYDSSGNLTAATNPLGNQTLATYNIAGQPHTVADPLGNTTQFTYDRGHLVGMTSPLGHSISAFFDSGGRLASSSNPNGRTTRLEYDAMNRPVQVTDPLQGVTSFGFDPNGNLLSVTDARNNSITYVYDQMDRVEKTRDPLLRETLFQYNANGALQQVTDRKGQVTSFTYDALDRLTQVTYDDGSTTSYSYDLGNRVTQITDSVSGTISFTYDSLDRVLSETTAQGVVSYTYDAASRVTSMTVAGQPAVNYSYDAADRLTQITQGSSTVSFSYDAAGRVTSQTLPNGIVTEYGYDMDSRLALIAYKLSGNTIGDLIYEYDAAGRRVKVGGSFARTGLPAPVTSASYNAANQQTSFGGQSLSYDLNGNLTGDGVNTYIWNARDQLVSISGPGLSASFEYDGFGRRKGKTINGATTSFLYDGYNIVQEQVGGAVAANILSGGIDQLFLRSDSSCSCSALTDPLGSVLALADSTGVVQTEYTYEPFGKTTETGSTSSNASKYTGREDEGAGRYYYRLRYYSAESQRFISEDPIGIAAGYNVYSYVSNNPLSFTDPFGLDKQPGGSGATRTPAKGGPPGGKQIFPDGKGGRTERYYGPDGRAERDVDYGHDHGAGDPHVHDWDWSKDRARQPARPPHPGEHLRSRFPVGPTLEEARTWERSARYREQAWRDILIYSIYFGTAYLGRPIRPNIAPAPVPVH